MVVVEKQQNQQQANKSQSEKWSHLCIVLCTYTKECGCVHCTDMYNVYRVHLLFHVMIQCKYTLYRVHANMCIFGAKMVHQPQYAKMLVDNIVNSGGARVSALRPLLLLLLLLLLIGRESCGHHHCAANMLITTLLTHTSNNNNDNEYICRVRAKENQLIYVSTYIYSVFLRRDDASAAPPSTACTTNIFHSSYIHLLWMWF